MTTPLGFDTLKDILHRRIEALSDHRTPGPNTRYRIQDAALGAFGIFFTPSSSFLDYQRPRHQTQGQNTACTLFGVETMPWNHQRRHLLDPLMPRHRDGGSLEVLEGLEPSGSFSSFRVLADHLLLARDGPQYFSSNTMHCPNCLRRHTAKGPTLYSHSAITPVIVCPGRSAVLAWPPACIRPQDGHDQQDGERVAGKRWIDKHAKHVAPSGVTLLGDDLSSHQPLCTCARQNGLNFIFVCQPDAHATRDERVAFWQATDAIKALETRRKHGRITESTLYRYMNEVFLRGGPGAVAVHGLEITSVHATTGAPLSHHSFITTHRWSAANVAQVAQAGRGRWKVENDNNHVLNTTGDHLEHTLGHGKRYLAAFLLSLNVLALLCHTVLPWCDAKYALRRQVLGRRQTLCEDLRALTRYMVCERWPHVMAFMIRGLQLESKLDPG